MARLGHEAAFEAIVERYRAPLLGHCRRIAGHSCAQDAVQQAFLSAWCALRSDCEVRALRPWLFTIAHRAALGALREQGKLSVELPGTLIGARSPAENAEESARTQETLAAIAELPPSERDALVLTAMHGRSGRDTARALGVSENAVRQLVFRARARMRAAVPVFVPAALLRRLSAGVHRVTALGDGYRNTLTPETGGMLVKVTAVVAAGTLLGTRMATLHVNDHHRNAPSAPPVIRGSSGPPMPSAVSVPVRARARTLGVRASARAPLGLPAAARVSNQSPAALAPPTNIPGTPPTSPTAAPPTAIGAPHERLAIGSSAGAPPQPVGHTGAPQAPVTEQVTPPPPQIPALPPQVTPPPQVTAPLHQVIAPLHQVIAGATGQLPQGIASAVQGGLQTGKQEVEQVLSNVARLGH